MNKKKLHPILKILFVLFIVFIALFIANMSGYYESKIRDRMVLTNDSIKEFEEKVQNGEEIDIYSFLDTEREDYSNFFSKLGSSLGNSLENFITSGVDYFGDFLKSLF